MAETFAEEVSRRRRELRLTQVDLAKLSGVSRTTIKNVEQGEGPRGSTVDSIRAALDAEQAQWVTSGSARNHVETLALDVIIAALARLGSDERCRVLAYLNDRYGGGS